MLRDEASPDYEHLFGELGFGADDGARTVYSPAAYFVDLLALLEASFDEPSLLERRSDLKRIVLDAENTFTETPYLDIVNEVLERLLDKDPYAGLRERRHPFGLPFSLPAKELATYLRQLRISPLELYRLFATVPDHDVAARESLGLSPEDVAVLTAPAASGTELESLYGLSSDESLEVLAGVERFAEACDLTGEQVQELIPVRPPVRVSADGETLQWGGIDPATWLDQAHRFVRLARMTGIGFADLGLAVTSCCADGIDLAALRSLAIVVRLHREHGLTVEDVCRLVVAVEPEEVQGCSGDILADRNQDYRFRLAGWIGVTEGDIVAIVRRYRQHYRAAEPGPLGPDHIDLPAVGLLRRAGCLAGALGIGVDELFDVLTALNSEPLRRRYPDFGVLGEPGAQRDVFEVLAGGEVTGSLSLAQLLFAVLTWMQAAGFSAQELTGVLGGSPEPDDGTREAADGVGQAFAPVAFGAALFEGDRFGDRAARVVHDVLSDSGRGVVAEADGRLLRLDPPAAAHAAYDAVTELGVVTDKDFVGLGLGERLRDKVFTNLVLLGHLTADGEFQAGTADGIALATDFTVHRDSVFKLIGSVAGGAASFFPSDLAQLPDLPPGHRTELYDNLIHHGYLGPEGELADPGFFTDPDNLALFEVNVDLQDATEPVTTLLNARITRFTTDPLPIDTGVFAGLRMSDARLTALVESLTFNGYLDENGRYRDKAALAGLPVADFGLALEFYPRRREILDAVQGQIRTFESRSRTFAAEDFDEIADVVVSRRVFLALEGEYLGEGRIADETLFAPTATRPVFAGFSAAERDTALRRVRVILDDQRPYRVDPAAVTALGFTAEERDRLLSALVAAGHLTGGLAVAEDRLPYFRSVHSGHDFAFAGLEDHSKDIFFLLHPVAAELSAAVTGIVDTLTAHERQQKTALFGALADVFGVPAGTAAAICEAVTGGPDEVFDVLIAPLLDAGTRPAGPHLRLAVRRIRRFALLAAKLGLDATEVTAVFRDRDLAGKFPENLALPPGVNHFDALLETTGDKVLVFAGAAYWTYEAGTLASPVAAPLTELSPGFLGLTEVDAAFTLPSGVEWIVGHTADGTSSAFTRQPGETRWAPKEQTWGKVENAFDDPERIDGAFADSDGRTYLVHGDQYIRYSSADYTHVDEGYPRPVTEWREREGIGDARGGPLDAFQAPDGEIHVLTGATGWGRARNTFEGLERLDAAHTNGSAVELYAGDQVIRYSDSIENADVRADEGQPRRISGVPGRFESGVEAAFTDPNGVLHLFKDGTTAAVDGDDVSIVPTAQRWGVSAPALPSGTVDAAFAGLDGKTYLFSGRTYLRYSDGDYTVVDVGYPRSIDGDWGGLETVDAAFVMDGSTYLFGVGGILFELAPELHGDVVARRLSPALRNRFAEHGFTLSAISGRGAQWTVQTGQGTNLQVKRRGTRMTVHGDGSRYHVRYGGNDYRTPDAGFPKPLSDNWWNIPDGLAGGPIDAVFTGRDDHTYLFSGDRFLRFDARHRWWSEPMSLREGWDSVPFDKVDAAFVGHDGRTYLFSGSRFVRYSTGDYTEVDDRYPASVAGHWDNVRNNIGRTGRVDATLVTDVTETVEGFDVPHTYTYLFSGDQYVRYVGTDYERVQPGYPRLIEDLSTEPGLAALDVELDGVDAAFADRRTTYLFRGGQCHAVSAETYRRHDDPGFAEVSCAFVEDGSVVAAGRDGWVKRTAIEGRETGARPFRPRTLRSVPPEFRTGLDSVLTGTDGTTYLFKGTSCFNTQLNRSYPLAQEWGRPRNTIYQENRVDAAFVGRDGGTYLFSGDQFVAYPADAATIDDDPRPIAEHWAGLTGVALAYVDGDRTVLFEHPDESGQRRHVVYSGTDYSTPDDGYPAVAGEDFFGTPGGFPFPQAVLAERDTMILLSGEDCVSRDTDGGSWSVARPIDRLFPGFDSDTVLRAAFVGEDCATYFFFDETYARFADGAFGPHAQIRDRWGLSGNPFVTDGHSTVDAAFVWRGELTYLFSGDRYVRYTGPRYDAVDAGYPKPISGNLRREEPFGNLPEAFEDALDRPIDAVFGNDRSIHLIIGGVVHTVSPAATATFPIDGIGRVRNTFTETGTVDAALVADRRVYLFSGDQYVRYSSTDYSTVDDGYPKPVEQVAAELDLPALPVEFQDGIDAAFRGPDGRTYLFRDRQFLTEGTSRPISGTWGKVRNEFDAGRLDTAFVAPTGDLYAFAKDQYVRYEAEASPEFAEPGFPRTIRDDWGDLPAEFESGLDGAFSFEGRTYLAKGDSYVRYSGDLDQVDRTFPQEFRHRWSGPADYRLTDVHTITRFVDLLRSGPDGLAEFFVDGAEDPYQYLAEGFGWDVEELRWARRNRALVLQDDRREPEGEIGFLLKLVEVFATARRLGAGPSELHTEVWSKLHRAADPEAAASALRGLLERKSGPQEWEKLGARLHNELNVLKRDALVSALAPRDGGSRELFQQYLIDVDMGPEGTTSRIREAIAATQLFLHRYLLDLETVKLPAGADPDELRARLKTWWTWTKNYRTWEANRKVFLYPENYLRPELRTNKTPAFTALEQDLLQTQITSESVLAAYKRYLDEYTEVSRLAIAGGYVYAEDDGPADVRKLVLFGRTRTEPRRYYHRTAEFRDGGELSATWEPWRRVDVAIDADRVGPVHAFGRVFVFWPTAEAVAPAGEAGTTVTTTPVDDGQQVSAPPPKYRVKISYSFLNLNQEWVPAQTLAVDGERDGPITGLGLYVQASRTVPGGDSHDSIVVQCSYLSGEESITSAYTLTPELYGLPAEETIAPAAEAELGRIFADPDADAIEPAEVVRFNAPADTWDGPWVSVDHKGGSFLCRPSGAAGTPDRTPFPGNRDNLPTTWTRIDAGVELGDGTRYFFDNGAGQYIVVPPGKDAYQQTRRPIAERFGFPPNNLIRTGSVDAALVRGNHVYLFCGDEYYRFTELDSGALEPGYPKKLADNTENLPRWTKIDAAFAGPQGSEVFYSRERNRYVVSGDLTTQRRLSELWQVPENQRLDAVLYRLGSVYAVLGDQYVKLTSGNTPAPGYPRALAGNPDGVPEQGVAGPSFSYGLLTVAFANAQGTYTLRAQGIADKVRQTRLLGATPTELTTLGKVNAAYVDNGKLFLVTEHEYVRYTLDPDGSVPQHIDAGYPKIPTVPVLAVFERDGGHYVFSENHYGMLEAGEELDTGLALRPYEGNWRFLPQGFPGEVTGALDAAGRLFLFLSDKTYAAYEKGQEVAQPCELSALPTEIIRLTSSTAYELNRRLLVGGVDALLAPDTQELDERPAFSATASDATTVRVTAQTAAAGVPVGSHLDFDSSNGIYYWEIFFHAPMLIAQALNDAQRFDDARRWYEYVFDPTDRHRYWRFLPFLGVDVRALADGCRADLDALGEETVASRLNPILDAVEAMAPAFLRRRELSDDEAADLVRWSEGDLAGIGRDLTALTESQARNSLRERVELLRSLERQYHLLGSPESQLDAYRNDPFDPHRIAQLRPAAYRRATVMAYIDNLLDWGDLLFRQYTAESLDEARMLYVFAHDLLGERPYDSGPPTLPTATDYDTLDGDDSDGDGESTVAHLTLNGALLEGSGAVHASVANPYFSVPGNEVFLEYWTRVEDRLRKIRASLDILGISRPVPLFEPPADVASLVAGAAKGVSTDRGAVAAAVAVPAYRFAFLYRRAQELTDRCRQLGADLLGAFERHDSEELALLQNRQEAAITALTRSVKENQVQLAQTGLDQLLAARTEATGRAEYYGKLVDDGLSPLQEGQIAMMSLGAAAHFVSGGLKIGAAIASGAPQVYAGPFIMGTSYGGDQVGDALSVGSEVSESFGEAFSLVGELLGIRADQERQTADWRLQLASARSDVTQIGHQVAGAELQVAIARRELDVFEREARNLDEVSTLLTGKFAGAELYRWMTGRLSGLYFQTYNLAYETAKAAEKAYRFERGSSRAAVIQPSYWDTKRNGLLAAEALALDLDRLGQAQVTGDTRNLEITKQISLLRTDATALLALKNDGSCEFALTEDLFDRDFPGHYRRQLRTVGVSFATARGPVTVNATLTQLDNKTVLSPDPKAVKYLLDPKGAMPESLRGDWRPSQQIALSEIEPGRENNGLFELRYDDDRYLPFEGTGAVSRWRLEAGQVPADLVDVTVTVKYTAAQGGETFATAVKGMLRPFASARYLSVADEFPGAWAEFLDGDTTELSLPIIQGLLPDMVGRQITGVGARYSLMTPGEAKFTLNGPRFALEDGQFLRPPGLTTGLWTLTFSGDKAVLADLGLILTYRAGTR